MNDNYKNENFREFLNRLRTEKELIDIKQTVDIRHIATLVDQAETALLFHISAMLVWVVSCVA